MNANTSPSRSSGWLRPISLSALGQIAGVLVYLVITLGPLVGLSWDLLTRVCSGQISLMLRPRTWRLLRNSLGLAATVSVLATVMGTGIAIWTASGEGRLRYLARRTFILPLLIPPYVYALTWLVLLRRDGILNRGLLSLMGAAVSPYGFAPTALVLAIVFSPIVTLLVLMALDSIGPEVIETARVFSDDKRVWYEIVLPLALPALLAGMGLVFALTLVEYGVPALLEMNVYSREIFAEFSHSGDPVATMGLAAPFLVLTVALVLVSQSRWQQAPLRATPRGRSSLWVLPQPHPLRLWSCVSVLALAVGVLVPTIVLLLQTKGISAIWHAATTAQKEIRFSLALALGTAAAATMIAVPSSQTLSRRGHGWVWALYALPLAIPAPLYAVGLIHLWNRYPALPLYGSSFMLLLTHVGRFLPYAVFALVAQFRQVDPPLHEAARLHPVGWLRRAITVHVPLLGPGLIACAGIVFVLSLGELGGSLLVVPPGSATVSLRLFNLLHYGASETVAGLALIAILLVGLAGAVAFWLPQRKRR